MKRILTLITFISLITVELSAQFSKETKQIGIQKSVDKITVDGILDEKSWEQADIAKDFILRFPHDTALTNSKTEVRLTYDNNAIYVGFICYDLTSGPYVIESRRRDFSTFGAVDLFSVVLDPFQDQTNGFEFTINPYNVQREALIANGGSGRNSTSESWDNIWQSKTTRLDDRWVGEIAIPFKTIRYPEGSNQWRINFVRHDSKQNERGNWNFIPRNFRQYNLASTGMLNWDRPPGKPGANMTVIPYISGGSTKTYDDPGTSDNEEQSAVSQFGVGGDAKIGIGPSLNLDLTVSPDFSQVEVDRQVTNLDRFEINFPERRQFFLENNDLFTDFGSSSLRPFFTRRIGIAKDTAGNTVENQIHFGARLSGKLNQNLRIGLLNMQTGSDQGIGVNSTNYTVAVAQHRVFKRSNISAIFINKHEFFPEQPIDSTNGEINPIDPNEDPSTNGQDHFNRVAGIDYNHASADGVWTGKVFYHQSLNDDNTSNKDAYSHGARLLYDTPDWEISWDHEIVGENYDAEVGFIRRTGYKRISPSLERKFYPKSKWLNRHGPQIELDALWSEGLGLTDRTIEFIYAFRFNRGDYFRMSYVNDFVKLTSDFDPTRTDGVELLTGEEFTTNRFEFFYWSDSRKKLTTRLFGGAGEYFNGNRTNIGGEVGYRIQPLGLLSMNFSYNNINLPDPYNDADLVLLGPKIDLTFTNSLFLSVLVQYNNQRNRFDTNTRFQWRFKPASDIFVVFTDNYYANTFKQRNRGIIVKMTYWLNL